jgi:hypothetical protein
MPKEVWQDGAPVIVAFGGGLNSSALLLLMYEKGIRPDLIIFADTGGERPETYAHVQRMQNWSRGVRFPTVEVVTRRWPKAGYSTLEDQCLKKEDLPSRAYGFSTCAYDWKLEPFWARVRMFRKEVGLSPKVLPWKLVGFDGGEERRAKLTEDKECRIGYPLIDWNVSRAECQEVCDRHGMFNVPKSSCFFCPSMKKGEIVQLGEMHPGLLQRALTLEEVGLATSKRAKGLGRSWNWGEFVRASEAERAKYREQPVESCTMCADGPSEDDE